MDNGTHLPGEQKYMKKVLIPTKLEGIARETLEARGTYQVVQDESASIADLAAKHQDAYALIVRSENVTASIIDALPDLKVIIRAGSGYNTIDTKYARGRHVDVMNTPGANANAVAEEVVALMLADARHIVPADASARAGKWEKKKFMGREIAGKTVGIVGLGNIGQLVARRLSGFECTLLGYDPVIANERAEEVGVTLTDLPTLFSSSDYVTLHIPENKDTKGIVGENYLALMKQGATLINCARAGIIDEDALRTAKTVKGLRFLNDVYAKDAEGAKSTADVADIMLPHLGASTIEANSNAARRAAEQLIGLDEKGITSFVVNRDIPEGLDEAYCDLANTLGRLCRCIVGRDAKLKSIETSIYGALEPFGEWLLVPTVAGIWPTYDRSLDYRSAMEYLSERGIDYVNRKPDPAKGFQSSITVELGAVVDSGALRKAGVRGTVAESRLMISRIDGFDKLYFEPKGHNVFFRYHDRPGVIGAVGLSMAKAGINIVDMHNRQDPKTNQALAIMRTSEVVPEDVMNTVAGEIEAISAFALEF
jgi:D-3-phosphoglycerate dehydrogenase